MSGEYGIYCALLYVNLINNPRIKTMYILVLLRHGLSEWNLQNRFTGWQDVDLADAGITEARNAGQSLREAGFAFDAALRS